MNINKQTHPLFMFVCLTYRTKFLVCVCSFVKRTSRRTVHKLFVERSVHL
ncbi:hypothetical protein Hanom_Chr12g01078671 [Helianthus anomalus]